MLTLLGVMTGTSCDGLDATAVRFSGRMGTGPKQGQFSVLWNRSVPYPSALRTRVLRLQSSHKKTSIQELLELHRDLGEWYGATLKKMPLARVDAIANHGQTVAHFPPKSTLQLGEAACIAHSTGITVVSDFRWGDLATGGQGAPLVPAFHQDLYERSNLRGTGLAIHNLGGVSNLTYLRPDAEPLAWDTGPANLWIDAIVRHRTRGVSQFDAMGRLAARGKIHPHQVARLLSHPFFLRRPPKSTGRDDFAEKDAIKITASLETPDAVATVTAATARSISDSYVRFILKKGLPLSKILVCGGGARNPTLLKLIELELIEKGWFVSIEDSSKIGIDPQYMESTAFAFLGHRALRGRALGGGWTGGALTAPPAKITPGQNWSQLLRKIET
ncbi:MAG: anhydro-N-acetylmuramic acid kinase [Oligoflexia bacterium]